jgi:hypothetical protein
LDKGESFFTVRGLESGTLVHEKLDREVGGLGGIMGWKDGVDNL